MDVSGRRLWVRAMILVAVSYVVIGIGFAANGMESAQSLVARADRKLYQAKAAGRGGFSSAREANAA